MLTYKKDGENFIITETVMSFTQDRVTIVTYNADLSQSKVNNEPWTPTTKSARIWFERFYRRHFSILHP